MPGSLRIKHIYHVFSSFVLPIWLLMGYLGSSSTNVLHRSHINIVTLEKKTPQLFIHMAFSLKFQEPQSTHLQDLLYDL